MRTIDVKERLPRRRGFSLIELACVLAIIAIILAGVMLLFSTAQESGRIRDSLQEVTVIVSTAHSLYGGQPNGFANLQVSDLINSGLLPARYISGDRTTLVNPWNGPVDVGTVLDEVGALDMYVQIRNISQDACERLSVSDVGNATDNMEVNFNIVVSRALTVSEATQFCVNNGSNRVFWGFR